MVIRGISCEVVFVVDNQPEEKENLCVQNIAMANYVPKI